MTITKHLPTPFETLRARLRDGPAPRSPRELRAIAQELADLPTPADMRLALLGNVTLDVLSPFLHVAAAELGWHLGIEVAPFGQHRQYLDDEALTRFEPDIVALFLSLELLRPDAMAAFAALDADGRKALRDDICGEIGDWIDAALARTSATLLVANFAPPAYPALGTADAAHPYSEAEFHHDLQRYLIGRVRAQPRVQLLDLAGATARIGSARGIDHRMQHLAKAPWSAALMGEIAGEVARHMVAAAGAARKCLVVDLDNTLWGGVLGEDGPWGIEIGEGSPAGEAFAAFQRRVKMLGARGVLLAFCSKNNPHEVDALFAERIDMPLGRDDFAARSVGWEDKALGLAAIAKSLNIGLEALVFLDDNPAEIAMIRARLPQVEAVLMPDDPALYGDTLQRLPFFEKSIVLAEDRAKTAHYAEAAQRNAMRGTSLDTNDYLRKLGIVLDLRPAREEDLPRLHQLFTKTNQFNVTTKRYTVHELSHLIASPLHRFEVASMRDAFGDLGLIAASIVETVGPALRVDSFVMSCRAMGRGAEIAIVNGMKRLLGEGHELLRAEYRPTPRNAPVAALFEAQGFSIEQRDADGKTVYQLAAADAAPLPCDWITVPEGERHADR